MSIERTGLLLPDPIECPKDQVLFESFKALLPEREIYDYLSVDDEKKTGIVEAWHEGRNPDLSADHLDEAEIIERKSALKQWKKQLLARDDIAPEIKQLYRWKVNEAIANVNMLEASSKGDVRGFRRWNEFIYGKPDEAIYRGALDWVAHDAENLLSIDGQAPAVVDAAQEVLDRLNGSRGYRELLAPTEETFRAVREDHLRPKGYYGLLLAGVDIPDGKVTNEVGDPILEHIIETNLQSGYKLADASGSTWGVSRSTETVERPKIYNMPAKRFTGLAAGHEIGSHLLEKVNGSRGPLGLAAIGLDRYESGNEGRAVIREEVVYETFDQFGDLVRWRDIIRRHIAVSYGFGIGEDGPKSSSEVYDLINLIDTMYQSKLSPDDPETTKLKARAKTDSLLLRELKGTDGTAGAYLKDKVYLEGHVANWLTAATRGPQAISEGDLGKFDINNPRHIQALQKLGLLPDNE